VTVSATCTLIGDYVETGSSGVIIFTRRKPRRPQTKLETPLASGKHVFSKSIDTPVVARDD
jgi:hypothetical protein